MVLGPAGKQTMQSMGLALNGIVIELEIRSLIWRRHYNIPSEAMWKREFNVDSSQNRELIRDYQAGQRRVY